MADLTEQSAVAAEGIKQLVDQGRKTLSIAERIGGMFDRLGSSSPVARVFAEAAMSGAGMRSQQSAVQQSVQNGAAQIQAVSQPKQQRQPLPKLAPLGADEWPGNMPPLPNAQSATTRTGRQARQLLPRSWESIQASMLHALATGGDPAAAARQPAARPGSPLGPGQWPSGMPGLPLGPKQWPAGMPGLPVGSPGNPAPPNMPSLPGSVPVAAGTAASGMGLSGVMGSILRVGGTVGVAAAGLMQQFGGNFSAGHGMSQWLRESDTQADYQKSLLTRLRIGVGFIGDSAGDSFTGQVKGAANLATGLGKGLWEHFFSSSKTGVGNGVK